MWDVCLVVSLPRVLVTFSLQVFTFIETKCLLSRTALKNFESSQFWKFYLWLCLYRVCLQVQVLTSAWNSNPEKYPFFPLPLTQHSLTTAGYFKIVVDGTEPYVKPNEPSPCSNPSLDSTPEGVNFVTLNSDIRHYKVLSIVLGILTFVFAATSFLLAAMQIGQWTNSS